MAVEHLWTMLCARGSQLGVVGHDYKQLTADDVRGALQFLQKGPFHAAMLIRCGDRESHYEFSLHLWRAIRDMAKAEGWQAHKSYGRGRMDVLIRNLVVIEHTYGGRACPLCNGTGHLHTDVQPTQCDACQGRGRVKLRDIDKAIYCGMTRKNWSTFWSRRYNASYAIVDDWLSVADRHVRKRIRDYEVTQ